MKRKNGFALPQFIYWQSHAKFTAEAQRAAEESSSPTWVTILNLSFQCGKIKVAEKTFS